MADVFASPVVQAVGLAIVHFVWQGAAIGLATALALRLTRRASAHLRYLVASIGLVALAAAPVVTTARAITANSAATETPPITWLQPAATTTLTDGLNAARTAPSPAPTGLASFLPVIVIAWSFGVLVLSLRLARGWLDVRRIRRHASRHVPPILRDALARVARRFPVPARLIMGESTMVDTPTLIGWIRPAILMPTAALAGLSPSQLEAVLLHELAHIRRHDYLINNLQHIVETALFYHPAVWWVSAEMRREREHCCDDTVIAELGDRIVYAQTLAALEASRQHAVTLAVAATGGHLLARVRRVLGAEPLRTRRPSIAIVACLMMGLAALVSAGRGAQAASQPNDRLETVAPAQQSETVFVAAPQTTRPGSVTPVAPPRPVPAPRTRPAPVVPATSWEVEIRELEERFRVAKLQNDVGTLDVLLDDDYIGTNQSGVRRNKTELIELFRAFPIQALSLGFMAIQVKGERAVVNGSMTEISGTSDYPMLFTRVWVRFGNTWRLLSNTQFRDPRGDASGSSSGLPPVRVGGDIREPRKVTTVAPVYPPTARAARIQGIVIIEAVIDETGTPTNLQVLRGDPMLDEAALEAVRQWRYQPTTMNGVPVKVMMTVTINFSLQDTAAPPSPTSVRPPLRVGPGVAEPTKILNVAPAYPPAAREARIQGIVIIEAVIDETGSVASPKVLRGHPVLNQAAIDAVRQWKYAPTLLNGVPVAVMMTVTVNFSLAN